MHRALLLLIIVAAPALAGPYVLAGDLALRHDIQRLASYGVIRTTVTTWPLAWGPILDDIANADVTELPPDVVDALGRVKRRDLRRKARRCRQRSAHPFVPGNAARARRGIDRPQLDQRPLQCRRQRAVRRFRAGRRRGARRPQHDRRCAWQLVARGKHRKSLVGPGLGWQPDPVEQRAADTVGDNRSRLQ